VSGVARAGAFAGCVAVITLAAGAARPAETADVTWHPKAPRIGDVAWLHVKDVPEGATVEGSVDGRPLTFFPYAGGHAALLGIDLETKPGVRPWRTAVVEPGREPRSARGTVRFEARRFPVERLTLPRAMVELDPDTERRAQAEALRLAAVLRAASAERLWRGRFTRPVAGTRPGTGFGARRIINGRPRAPHSGTDYSAPLGTPVVAVNTGRAALVGEFFFHGRLVVLDHGLGLYTLYFHLDSVTVSEGQRVERGQTLGTVGATGRATGPHLHFAAQVGAARVDPAVLLGLALGD
jgi:murein DD-endopeptidase MepM/ murein hydrolase activator NlpD